jgi:hypothetical protein
MVRPNSQTQQRRSPEESTQARARANGVESTNQRIRRRTSVHGCWQWYKPDICKNLESPEYITGVVTANRLLHGIVLGSANHLLGKIELGVCFGDSGNFQREKLEFEVMDWPSQYHAILGRPTFARFMAVSHYSYLTFKIPGPKGVITVKGSFEVSNTCDKKFNIMAQTFGMTTEYARLKVETDHNLLPDVGRSILDQAFNETQDSKKVRVHPTDPAKTTSIVVNLDPA